MLDKRNLWYFQISQIFHFGPVIPKRLQMFLKIGQEDD